MTGLHHVPRMYISLSFSRTGGTARPTSPVGQDVMIKRITVGVQVIRNIAVMADVVIRALYLSEPVNMCTRFNFM